ncbi:MAG: hypothetical protein MK165_16490 [Pirellulaceae bacterium]|nr:hypothetical protein [Pirellulaceae bacterium]
MARLRRMGTASPAAPVVCDAAQDRYPDLHVDEKTTLANILDSKLLAAARAWYGDSTLHRQDSVLSGMARLWSAS